MPKPLLPELTTLIGPDAPFAGFSVAEIRDLEDRFADANRRFALDYGIDAAGALFRDAGHGAGPRPAPRDASWGSMTRGEVGRRATTAGSSLR